MFVENIIYINLDYRTDRYDEIEREMDILRTHYPFTVERFSAIHRTPGIIGCGYSHLQVLQYAHEKRYPYVWIIEDDFTCIEPIETIMSILERLDDLIVTQKAHFDVIFLAYNMIEGEPYCGDDGIASDFLFRTTNCQTASSYIVCRDYYETLICNIHEGLGLLEESQGTLHYLYANDQYWKTLQRRDTWVCVVPRCGKQRSSFSDNSQCFMEYNV